jgi:cell division initiation protein
MAITPVEIRHVRLKRVPFGGYLRAPTERLLLEIADSFEEVWRERAEAADRVEQLEEDLVRHRELEALLRQTLVSAERTAAELRDGAQKQATLVVEEAHAVAREILRAARAERERLHVDSSRIRAQLEGALDVPGERDSAAEAA